MQVAPQVSFDVNPTSRQILENLVHDGHLQTLLHAGARIHQAGCNGCIGMGQAPASGKVSLRTVPRNFPGRSGTRDDQVCLVSPETAAASARTGVTTDPRTLEIPYPRISEPDEPLLNTKMLIAPPPADEAAKVELVRGENIVPLPELEPLPDSLEVAVLLKMGDNISTDEILPAGARVLPYRSNVPALAEFAFDMIDQTYPKRARSPDEGRPCGCRRPQLRARIEPRARRTCPAVPRPAAGDRQELCPDSLAEPDQLRRPAADARGRSGLRSDRIR